MVDSDRKWLVLHGRQAPCRTIAPRVQVAEQMFRAAQQQQAGLTFTRQGFLTKWAINPFSKARP
jgi:hypothetical protein